MSNLQAALGEIYALESQLPAFGEVEALANLPSREARLSALKGWSLLDWQDDYQQMLSQSQAEIYAELQPLLSDSALLSDLLWLQNSMADIRRIVRESLGELNDEGGFVERVAEVAPEVEVSYHTMLIAAWERISTRRDSLQYIEIVLDRFYLDVLTRHYFQLSAGLKPLVEARIDEYNVLTWARLLALESTEEKSDLLYPQPMGTLPRDFDDWKTLSDILAAFDDEAEGFGLKLESVTDLQALFRVREMVWVNGALFEPEAERTVLQFMRRVHYLFYDLKLVMLEAKGPSRFAPLLVDYDTIG